VRDHLFEELREPFVLHSIERPRQRRGGGEPGPTRPRTASPSGVNRVTRWRRSPSARTLDQPALGELGGEGGDPRRVDAERRVRSASRDRREVHALGPESFRLDRFSAAAVLDRSAPQGA